MQLIQMRDPAKISGVEIRLLGSQLGPLINECFLRQIDCFAEDPRWEPVLLSLQRNNKLILSLLVAQAKLGRFIRIAKEHVMSEIPCDPMERIRTLVEMHEVKEFTYQWEEDLEERRKVNDAVLNLHELPCAVYSCRINLNRIMVALDPLADDARILEEETQELAEKIMDWWNESAKISGERGDRLYTYPVPSAQIAIATKEEWAGAVDGLDGYINHGYRHEERNPHQLYTYPTPVPTARIAIAKKHEWSGALSGWHGFLDPGREVIASRIFQNWTVLMRNKSPTRKVSPRSKMRE